jgi:predicted SAM-dependent methyltransferase
MDMNAERPLISITMATHNRADLLLRRSIPSVLRQTYDNWELLVRGDGAGRDTELVINSFNDPRIKYKRLPRRLYSSPKEQWAVGGTHALNDALDEAQGDYIAHLDDDDEMLPDHFETLMPPLRSGDFDFFYARAYRETDGGWLVFGERPDVAQLQQRNRMVHCAVMYDRRKFGHLRYDIEGTEPADWRLWKKIAASGARLGFSDKIVAIHYAEAPHRRMSWLRFTHGLLDIGKTLRAHTVGLRVPPRTWPSSQLGSWKVKVNVGSGLEHRLGLDWKNLDILRGADIRADVRKGLPFEDGSVDFIYSEHFIEHVSFDEGRFYFGECHRVLKPGGVVRTATIDLAYALERYAQDWSNQTWVRDHSFETACEMLNAVFYMWQHKFIYDEEALKRSMVKGGFQAIESCHLSRSRHPELVNLETRPESRLILEGVKG